MDRTGTPGDVPGGGAGEVGTGSWGVQQLAGFLMAVAGYEDVPRMVAGAAQRIADAIGADVCAILSGDEIVAVVGFPASRVPEDELQRVAAGEADTLQVPGTGAVSATRVEARLGVPRTVLIGRRGADLDRGERALVRAMVQVLELALQLRGAAERERRLRQAVEAQAAELSEVNQRLERAVQVKRDLVSMASHELRTPLVAMLGFSRLLLDGWEDFDDRDRDEYLGILVRHGQRMLRLVDGLLTAGRLEDDRLETHAQRVSVSEVAEEAIRGVAPAGLGFAPAGEDEVVVDPDHLAQIVVNLVDNARKYGAPPVEVAVSASPSAVTLEVCDHGPGVPAEFVPVLFERFTQASTGMRREGSGVGLGLAIVSGLAERNGGTVAYARAEGRTRFTVRFPRAGRDRDAAAPG
ncbi:MAG: HAMP domain-containing histidine kinase [Actinobacteria bacterium]|nr:HAMP domain-containing histidine kinase [Actinomycetota bacterium]